MMDISIATATQTDVGGDIVASFGSGDSGGRTQRSAQGRAGNSNASRNQIASLRGRVNRAASGAGGRTRRSRELRALAQELQASANRRGNIKRRRLAELANRLREINSSDAQRQARRTPRTRRPDGTPARRVPRR